MDRYLRHPIETDLQEKMVFVGGPRQVGKTTLALMVLGDADPAHPGYINYDTQPGKKLVASGVVPAVDTLVFDEVHKYRQWRNYLKGLYDLYKGKKRILVTGSARLDHFRRGGDSLMGRYHYLRLHPLSLLEVNAAPTPSDVEHLLTFGGFPEPFLKGQRPAWQRWQNERVSRVVQEDLVSLEKVSEVSQLSLLAAILPDKVGSLLSINNLRRDLGVAFDTAERWVTIFDNLYYCFRVQAFGFSQIRAARKEKKLYLWDWSAVDSPPARFENLVASQLLKYCHFLNDTQGDPLELRFLRDSEKREIDFVVVRKRKPVFAVECKSGDASLSPNIRYFAPRVPIPKFYQVHLGTKHVEVADARTEIVPFHRFAQLLGV